MVGRAKAVAKGHPATVRIDLAAILWRPFTSVRLALILILLLTGAVLAGTLLEQAPASVLGNAEAYDRWLDKVRGKYGVFTPLLDTLQLLNVYRSFWFRLLVGLLTVNIVVCSLNRWKGIQTAVFGSRVRMAPTFFERSRLSWDLTVPLSLEAAASAVREGLGSARYRAAVEPGPSAALYADKNRFSRFGTFFSHLSIVLILVAALLGGLLGDSDDAFIIPEGSQRAVPFSPSISVGLDHFTDEYYLEGPPKDFRSDLVIYENGREVKRGTVRVNSPMSYKGIRFHQAFFGQAAEMEVKDASGRVLLNEGVPMAWRSRDGERPVGFFELPEQGLKAYVIGPLSGVTDPIVPAGEVRLELYREGGGRLLKMSNLTMNQPKDLEGLTFIFRREKPFTGLRVVKNPTTNLVWVASGLMVLGLVAVFYFPHRRVWALCEPAENGRTRVRLAAVSQRDVGIDEEFRRLSAKVRTSLGRAWRKEKGGEDV